MRKPCLLAALVALAFASGAAAQTVQRPSRPSRGLFGGPSGTVDPNRTHDELTLTGSFLGGYDDFIVPGRVTGETVEPPRSGSAYSGTGSGSLRYWRGRAARSFSVNAGAQSSVYSLADIDPTFGANVDLTANTQIGRRNTIGATQLFGYEPALALGMFGPITQTVMPSELPGGGIGSASVDQRSWSSGSSVNAQRRMTTRQTLTGTFTFQSRRYLNDLGYDSDARAADARYSWNVRRTTAIDATYRESRSSVQDPDGRGLPVNDRTIDAGLSYSRRLSPTRQIYFSGGGGATRVQTQEPLTRAALEYWTPSGHGMVRVDLGRTWALAMDYRRAINVLPAITLQSFATDAVSVRTNGRLGSRIEAVLSGAFMNGRAGYGESPSRYESYSGTAQLHFAVSRCCATTVTYDYYFYTLHQVTNVPTGIPNEYDRNTLRVGLSVWVPLIGAFNGDRGQAR